MNQDKDDILALRVENDPPIKVEVKRVMPTPSPGLERHLQALAAQQQAVCGLGAMTAQQQSHMAAISAQQQQVASPFGFGGRTILGGIT